MTTLFNKDVESSGDSHADEIQSYRDLLVGDGKKFKDEEDLAKGKYEADQFIERLLREKEEMRKDMEARLSLEELVSKLGSENVADRQPAQKAGEGRNSENSNEQEKVSIDELFEKAFERKQAELNHQKNLLEVEAELKKAWGSNYASMLQKAVQELQVSPTFVDDVAARSPKAALSLLLATKQKEVHNPAPPRTGVNTFNISSASTGDRSKAYYQKLRKENPKQYWSAKVQMEMHELALAGKLNLE